MVKIEVHRWFKKGDHPFDSMEWEETCIINNSSSLYPQDEYDDKFVKEFINPLDNNEIKCRICNKEFDKHGLIDTTKGEAIVCPGDWIITKISRDGKIMENYVCNNNIYKQYGLNKIKNNN